MVSEAFASYEPLRADPILTLILFMATRVSVLEPSIFVGAFLATLAAGAAAFVGGGPAALGGGGGAAALGGGGAAAALGAYYQSID